MSSSVVLFWSCFSGNNRLAVFFAISLSELLLVSGVYSLARLL
jgi:hypothetical protein